jgi:exonuclease III
MHVRLKSPPPCPRPLSLSSIAFGGSAPPILLAALTLSVLLCGCSDQATEPPPPTPTPAISLGENSTLEIMTWNIEWFPKAGDVTLEMVRQMVDTLDVDLIAVQEIADTSAFRALVESLDGYQGIYSPDTYGDSYQKTGILYRESVISVGNHYQILAGDWYAFPRPPMRFAITAEKDGHVFDFILIVVHLKAGDGSQDIERRRRAASELKDYMDARIASGAEKDYVVAGDWNDEIDDPELYNSFSVFLDSEDYCFLTTALTGDDRDASYPHFDSLIDHILISADALDESAGARVTTQRLDDVYAGYAQYVSDHRPVMARFPVFE